MVGGGFEKFGSENLISSNDCFYAVAKIGVADNLGVEVGRFFEFEDFLEQRNEAVVVDLVFGRDKDLSSGSFIDGSDAPGDERAEDFKNGLGVTYGGSECVEGAEDGFGAKGGNIIDNSEGGFGDGVESIGKYLGDTILYLVEVRWLGITYLF